MARYQVAILPDNSPFGQNAIVVLDTEITTRDSKPFVWKTFSSPSAAQSAADTQNSAVATAGYTDVKALHP